ncbi:hypothetical protein [Adhaeribacter aquaticus]|uniref:hypothetical protein n=1 Tax=Adhaeribacter aquaticus TaxID=299567 RepID=UPI00047C13BD|nr:hypothetical protein [Adhaeribacter aquaticus]
MKSIQALVYTCILSISLSGCATILGGPITTKQIRKPHPGQPKRDMRPGFVALDLITGVVPLFVDLATGAIYKPPKHRGE